MTKYRAEEVWSSKDKRSRLYWGESIAWMNSLKPESVDCIWTDPPYLLSNGGITCVAGKMVKVDKGSWDKSQGLQKDHEFNRQWIAACKRILKPAGTIWISGTTHVYLSVGMALLEEDFRILNDIIWEKPAPPPNLGCRCFTHSTEVLLWATKAKKGSKDRYLFNYEDMVAENGGKQMKNVWRFHTPSMEEKQYGKHPTQKPVELVARCLRACTKEGDLIVDPFAGSATTGVAALRLGRHFKGCEGDKDHVALAIKRLKDTNELSRLTMQHSKSTSKESMRTGLRYNETFLFDDFTENSIQAY